MMDSNPMSLLMHNLNPTNSPANPEKEPINIVDSESRDLVTVGSNEDLFLPALNHSKRPQQQTFQVLNEDDNENILH